MHKSQMKRAMPIAVLALAGALAQGPAQAADTYTLTLDGLVSGVSTSSFDIGTTHYDRWFWSGLGGLDSSTAFTVVQGDTIDATITLDGSYTIPNPVQFTWFILGLSGSTFPFVDTQTTATTSYFNSGSAGPITTGTVCTTIGQFSSCSLLFPPDETPITFDTIHTVFTIDTLSKPATLDQAYMYFTNFSPAVPEPETYAMMLVGLGLLGWMTRRKQRIA